MRIDRLEVENFKCFAKESFELHPRMTVFVGENGTGKTAVLDALAVAAGISPLGREGRRASISSRVGCGQAGRVFKQLAYPLFSASLGNGSGLAVWLSPQIISHP